MIVQRDHLWKAAFHRFMPYFVRFFFPHRYDEVDWTKKIVYLDKELNALQIGSRPKDRIADVLVMLHLKSGKRLFLLLHIEIQGYSEKEYPFRVHQMRYRIEDRFNANPVMLSVFTDDDPNFHPKEYAEDTWDSGHRTYFNTYKVMDHPPSTYADPDSPVSFIMEIVYNAAQMKQAATDEDIMKMFYPIVKKLLSKNFKKEDIRFIISFVEAHVKFGHSDNYRIFDKNLDKMVKFQTTAQIAKYVFDEDKQWRDLQKEVKKANRNAAVAQKAAERAQKTAEREAKRAAERAAERTTHKSILLMLNNGIDKDMITRVFSITIKDIAAIQKKYSDKAELEKLLNEPILMQLQTE